MKNRATSPILFVDRCREAATVAMAIESNISDKDLGGQIKAMINRKGEDTVGTKMAHIINRLHSRAKSAEQESRKLNPPTERHAELAIHLLGSILIELNLAQ